MEELGGFLILGSCLTAGITIGYRYVHCSGMGYFFDLCPPAPACALGFMFWLGCMIVLPVLRAAEPNQTGSSYFAAFTILALIIIVVTALVSGLFFGTIHWLAKWKVRRKDFDQS